MPLRPRPPAALAVFTTSPARVRGWRSRRGAVLPFVCILLTVLIGAAALAVDVGRLYVTASEVQSEADAAALAAASASQLTPNSDSYNGPARAQQYAARNRAANQAGNVATGDVVPLLYDPATRTSTVSSYFGTVNAVQVTARARPTYVFAGFLHLTPPTVARSSTAWIANVNGAACVRPVALPYTRIYEDDNTLANRPYSSQNIYAPDFTQVQVAALSPANGVAPVARTFVLVPPWEKESTWDNNGKPNTGSWHTVDYGGAGWSAYTSNIYAVIGSASCAAATTQVGDYLHPFVWTQNDVASITTYTTLGFDQLCHRGGNAPDAFCRDASGNVGVMTRVALSDSIPNPNGPFSQKVRMITQLRVMCYFHDANDICNPTQVTDAAGNTSAWRMPSAYPGGPPVVKGYPPATVVVLLDGPAFGNLTKDVTLGNTLSLTQRLVLVK